MQKPLGPALASKVQVDMEKPPDLFLHPQRKGSALRDMDKPPDFSLHPQRKGSALRQGVLSPSTIAFDCLFLRLCACLCV